MSSKDAKKSVEKIVVDGVELTVKHTDDGVYVTRVVGRDRERKLDLTNGERFNDNNGLLSAMKRVAALSTMRCTCGYGWGWSGHAEHCKSVYVAEDPARFGTDDD